MTYAPISLTPVLMAAQDPAASGAPEWVHLLPTAKGAIQTVDDRGPFKVTDAEALIALSFSTVDKLPIDENHATDLAAPQGLPAPARGWIVEMQARDNGIWGRVEWTRAGRVLVASHAYRAISPVVTHDEDKTLGRILRASLVNNPNFTGLVALNQERSMSFMAKLAELLGLDAAATEEQVIAAIKSKGGEKTEVEIGLQAALTEIGTALGVSGDTAAVIAAAKAAKTAQPAEIVSLQSEVATLTTTINGFAKERSTAFVDAEIAAGRVGLKPVRDRYISMHMADPTGTDALIKALPIMGKSGTTVEPPVVLKDGEIALNAEQSNAARVLGVDPKKYAETLAAEAAQKGNL